MSRPRVSIICAQMSKAKGVYTVGCPFDRSHLDFVFNGDAVKTGRSKLT